MEETPLKSMKRLSVILEMDKQINRRKMSVNNEGMSDYYCINV